MASEAKLLRSQGSLFAAYPCMPPFCQVGSADIPLLNLRTLTVQLTAEKIIELLESHKSYHGLYFYLGSHIAFSENPEVFEALEH